MQLKMINVLNKIFEKKKMLLDIEDEEVCENCGKSHSELEECSDLDEQSTTAGIAMSNSPIFKDNFNEQFNPKDKL